MLTVIICKRDRLNWQTDFLSGWSILLVIPIMLQVQTKIMNFLIAVQVSVTENCLHQITSFAESMQVKYEHVHVSQLVLHTCIHYETRHVSVSA